MRKIGRYLLVFLCFSVIQNIYAKNVVVEASLSADKISIGDVYTFYVIIKSVSGSVNPPSIEGSSYLSSSQNKNVSFINGALSSTTVFAHKYKANEVGTFIIPSVIVGIKGEIYVTEPLVLEVSEKREDSNVAAHSFFEDGDVTLTDKNLFMESSLSKNKAYIYEPLYFEQTAYTKVRSEILGMSGVGNKKDFWFQEDKNDQRVYNKKIKGVFYRAKVINREVLYPITPGRKFVDGNRYVFGITGRSIGIVDRVEISGNTVFIEVLPLPKNGKPKDFSGGVGNLNFSVSASFDQNLKAGDAVLLKISASGEANPNIITLPNIAEKIKNTSFKIYEPKEYVNTDFKNDGTLYGEKIAEYIIVPKKAGVFVIPEIYFSFFSPEKKAYKTVSSEAINLRVGEGKYEEDNNHTHIINPELNELEKPEIKETLKNDNEDLFFNFLNKYIYIYILILFLLSIFIFIFKKIYIYLKQKTKIQKSLSFDKAVLFLEKNDRYDYIKECEGVFYANLSSIFKTSVSSIDDVNEINTNANVKKNIKEILEKCGNEKYIPKSEKEIYQYHIDMENILKGLK